MDKVSKIGLAVIVLIFIGWIYWTKNQEPEKTAPSREESASGVVATPDKSEPVSSLTPRVISTPLASSPQVVSEEKPGVTFPSGIESIEVETDLISVQLSPYGGVIRRLVLKENSNAGIRPPAGEEDGSVVLFASESIEGAPGRFLNFKPEEMKAEKAADGAVFRYQYDSGIRISKYYRFSGDAYTGNLEIELENTSDNILRWPDGPLFNCGRMYPVDPGDSLGVDVYTGEDIIQETEPVDSQPAHVDWLAMKTKYFTAIFKPESQPASFFSVSGAKKNPASSSATKAILGCSRGAAASPYQYLGASMKFPTLTLNPGEKVSYSFTLFFGPANYSILKASGSNFQDALDLGLLAPICKVLIWLLNNIYALVGSFGWAIIILTILIKVVLWPLTHKSYASMGKMQKLQPQLAVLKEKYKGDAKKIQAETMKLYKEHGVNPMGGCLPMLLQMPILIALFTTLRNTILLRNAPFWIIPGTWIKDLSGPDVLMTLPRSYPVIGNHLNILPLLMGLSFFLQQKFTPTGGGGSAQAAQQQKMMATLMPIMFTFLFYSLPAGLNLYFMMSTFITVGQQLLTTRLKEKSA